MVSSCSISTSVHDPTKTGGNGQVEQVSFDTKVSAWRVQCTRNTRCQLGSRCWVFRRQCLARVPYTAIHVRESRQIERPCLTMITSACEAGSRAIWL